MGPAPVDHDQKKEEGRALPANPPGASSGPSERYVEKHAHIVGRELISSSALGLADGLVTDLAFLTGFGGAVADIGVIRLAGAAVVLAGAVSMFFGGILSARSEHDLFEADSRREAYEIENELDEEVWELKGMYMQKGLTKQEASMVVAGLSRDKDKFLEDMLSNELHIHRSNLQSPYRLGAVIGLSFMLGALVPLLPYLAFASKDGAILSSLVISLAFLFAAGAWKGSIVGRRAWRSGLEAMLVGAVATAILYAIGSAFAFV